MIHTEITIIRWTNKLMHATKQTLELIANILALGMILAQVAIVCYFW